MKSTLAFIVILFSCNLTLHSQVSVKGHYRKNGTYVKPHQRTRSNKTITDNYSYSELRSRVSYNLFSYSTF